jgi:hypothetical protein
MKSIANKIQTHLEAQLAITFDAYSQYINTSDSLSLLDTRKQKAEAAKRGDTLAAWSNGGCFTLEESSKKIVKLT